MTPTQLALIAIVNASRAVQEARDACADADAAAILDNAGQSVFAALQRVVKREAERRAAGEVQS